MSTGDSFYTGSDSAAGQALDPAAGGGEPLGSSSSGSGGGGPLNLPGLTISGNVPGTTVPWSGVVWAGGAAVIVGFFAWLFTKKTK